MGEAPVHRGARAHSARLRETLTRPPPLSPERGRALCPSGSGECSLTVAISAAYQGLLSPLLSEALGSAR